VESIIPSLIAGLGGGSPILLLMWGLIKDIRSSISTTSKTVSDIQLKIAEANYDLKIKYLEQSFERTIRGLEQKISSLEEDNTLLNSRVDAAWKHIDKLKGEKNDGN
jgi:predicted  nucleic acid-binding Zn-ribbon protein